MALNEFFVWGPGGGKLTPEQVAQLKAIEAKKRGGIDVSPVGHWTQGAARVADAIAGAFQRGQIDSAETEIADVNKGLISSLLGGASTPSTSVPMTGAAGEVAATSPAQPVDMTGNEVYSQFIDTVKAGGVQNPYALAAIAATGKAESGFEPGNVNRTWSDPSQSGQPGTAGGIMSWRGPRYDALAATGDLSPAGQAKFFLQENPQLIEALNKAGSLEEAQSLMNKAWAFAGYDQPGGEAARRLSAAQGFLPTFQGGGEVAAATPEAAIEAVSPTQGGSLTDEVAAFEQTPAYAAQFPGAEQSAAPAQTAIDTVTQAMPGQQPVQVAGGGGRPAGINPAIIEALTNPQASPQTQRIAGILLEQEQRRQQAIAEQQAQAADPLRQLQIRKAQAEVDALGRPQIPDAVQALDLRAQRAGLQPETPEYARFMMSGGDKGITINNEGTIPAGYQAVRDAEGRVTSIQPIPGSPAALEMEQALKAREAQGGKRQTSTDVITNAAANARQLIKSGTLTTGTLGRLVSNLTESDAAELRRQVDVLKSNASIENITAMRQASPTGAALGAASDKDLAMLASAAGAIDPNAGREQVAKQLDDYERTLLRTIHGPKVGDAILEQTRAQKPISEMTDEELEALANGD